MAERFTSYSGYLTGKYGEKTYRVSVDAGFSCPNRGGDRGREGCAFCDVTGSRSVYLGGRVSLEEQVSRGLEFLEKRYGARNFILYFQAYSNTYAPVKVLRDTYDRGLAAADFRELIVSTRPDCIDEEKADLLAEYIRPDRDVWVELGLQSANDRTLERVRRGHGVAEFERAFSLLRRRKIKITVHLIFGLPGEGEADILRTADYVGNLRPEGIKIHNLHIPLGAPLYRDFLDGEISLPSFRRHLDYVVKTLERLPPETVVMRFVCDTPKDRLAFPVAFPNKAEFLRALKDELSRRDTYQGRLFAGR